MNEFAMHDAAEDGDLEKVRQLIEAGVPVDCLDEQGQTPLHRAAFYGQYEVADLLISSKCNINLKDRVGRTPVMWAASCGLKDIVGLLLHRGAQVDCVDDRGCTLLQRASSNGWADIVRLILDNGEADLNAADQEGYTPLMWAVINGHKEIAVLLVRAGADVNRSNVQKWTALHFAVQAEEDVIQILLEKEGLDLNPQNISGQTPLLIAVKRPHYCREATMQLLNAGADVNMRDSSDTTALSIWMGGCKTPSKKEIRLFIQKGAFWELNWYYEFYISCKNIHKLNVLKDVELCTQSVVNKFHHQSLPVLNRIAYFARRLPNVDNFKLKARQINEVRILVQCEIERNTFCNVVKVHPISLSALCVLSLITCRSGKKRAASPDFGQSPFKKIHNKIA